jgi:putative phage-type endonuclease
VKIAREQWLAERRTGLGGSDVAALFGYGYRHTAYSLYLEKSGLLPPQPVTPQQTWGQRVEQAILDEYHARMGDEITVIRNTLSAVIRDPEKPFLLGTLDATAFDDHHNWIVDAKNVITFNSAEWGQDGTELCPKGLAIQMLHYMGLCPEMEFAHLAALIGGSDLRVIRVPRSEKLIRIIRERAERFWLEHVVAGVAPEEDFAHPNALNLAQSLYPKSEEITRLALTPRVADAMNRLLYGRALANAAKKYADAAKAELLTITRGASETKFDGGVVVSNGTQFRVKMPKGVEAPFGEVEITMPDDDTIRQLPIRTGDQIDG